MPMKILMLTWEYPPRIVGGIARVVNDLSKRLIKDGHEVTVVTYREGNAPYFEEAKIILICRKTACQLLDEKSFIDSNIKEKWYSDNDMHYIYFAEIEKVLISE